MTLKKILLIFGILAVLLYADCGRACGETHYYYAGMNTIDIVIQKQDGTAELSVKVAITPLQRQQGLMYVEKLEVYDGMLFDFGEDQFINMWMKNTFIPLDMLFFDSSLRLACIIESAVPHDETLLSCHKPVRYVLEIDGGRAKALGITAGDVLVKDWSNP